MMCGIILALIGSSVVEPLHARSSALRRRRNWPSDLRRSDHVSIVLDYLRPPQFAVGKAPVLARSGSCRRAARSAAMSGRIGRTRGAEWCRCDIIDTDGG